MLFLTVSIAVLVVVLGAGLVDPLLTLDPPGKIQLAADVLGVGGGPGGDLGEGAGGGVNVAPCMLLFLLV